MPGIFRRHCSQSCVYSDETTWRPLWFKTPEMALRDSKFQMSLDAAALKNLCLWCECQSRLPFTISLLIVYYYMELNLARVFREKYLEILNVEIATRQMMIG